MNEEPTPQNAVGIERGPAAPGPIVTLVLALPGELDSRLAVALRVEAVEATAYGDHAELAEPVVLETDERRLDEVKGVLIPDLGFGSTSARWASP